MPKAKKGTPQPEPEPTNENPQPEPTNENTPEPPLPPGGTDHTEELEANRLELKKTQNELNEFKGKLKKLFLDEEDEKEKDPVQGIQKFMESEFKKINERLDRRESEESLNKISDSFGLKSEQEKEFFEFKLAKAQAEKGDRFSDKDVENIGKETVEFFKKQNKQTSSSTVNETDPGPTNNLGTSDSVTYEKFKQMDLMERSKLFGVNPSLHDRLLDKENADEMNLKAV